ncbi:glycosyltransferase family 2 protein [Hoeflea prorocentri]|uniref:Glycosyltransferase family 2 protein n=1 Tax=Hoeflea prorocentri TaxID=1922333 RepID=A0A9X3UKS0_9HYPH|nr:glycosyltransferase family 2 protein [Hoeflea prorocentri]MCY6382220.1 glycosyltransferase family 2 protein [Hoeflea prorocentri]MDA5400020.1 glycosyltransferase family 2 protein [Hoeflea prorocentri]
MISIVIPCKNEAENIPPLIDEIAEHLGDRDIEVIVVNDGSTDNTAEVLTGEAAKRAFAVRHLRHDASVGQSLSLRSGVLAAAGDVVATIDGDGQNDPKYIGPLVDKLLEGGPAIGIACGQRIKRKDTKLKQLSSRFANWLRGSILNDKTRDSGCGLKAVHTDIFRRLPFFNGTHRFLPALVIQEGYDVVAIDVLDRPRRFGTSNYGILDRGARGALDLFGVWWLKRRRHKMPVVEEIPYD